MTQKYIKLSLKNIKPYLTKGSRKKQRGGADASPAKAGPSKSGAKAPQAKEGPKSGPAKAGPKSGPAKAGPKSGPAKAGPAKTKKSPAEAGPKTKKSPAKAGPAKTKKSPAKAGPKTKKSPAKAGPAGPANDLKSDDFVKLFYSEELAPNIESHIAIKGDVKENCIGKILKSDKYTYLFSNENPACWHEPIYGKLIKIETTDNIGDIFILVEINESEVDSRYNCYVHFLPTNFLNNLIKSGKISCKTLTLNKTSGAVVSRAISANIGNNESNMVLKDEGDEIIDSFSKILEMCSDLITGKQEDNNYYFYRYICICTFNYVYNVKHESIPELDSFGYYTMKVVLRAEKLHFQEKNKDKHLLGLRMAAVCNIICNGIFHKKKFKLIDGFSGPKITTITSVKRKDLSVTSDFLTFVSRVMIKNKYLKTLQEQKVVFEIEHKPELFNVTINYPDTEIPENLQITIDFGAFFDENKDYKDTIYPGLSDKTLLDILLTMTQTVYCYLIFDLDDATVNTGLVTNHAGYKNIYTFIYKEILSNFIQKPSGPKNVFIESLENIFKTPEEEEDIIVATIMETFMKYDLVYDFSKKSPPIDLNYLLLYEPKNLKEKYTKFKQFLTENQDKIIQSYRDAALSCVYNSSYYLFFVLSDLANNAYDKKMPPKNINRLFEELSKSESYYTLYGDFKGINAEDSDYLEFYFHSIA